MSSSGGYFNWEDLPHEEYKFYSEIACTKCKCIIILKCCPFDDGVGCPECKTVLKTKWEYESGILTVWVDDES